MIKNKAQNPAAFTLVELLVVISIIALLLAVLMPALNKVRDSAKTVVCAANEKQMGMAISMYSNSNGDAVIPTFGGDWTSQMTCWFVYLSPYAGTVKGSKTLAQGGNWMEKNDQLEKTLKVFKCPAQRDPFLWNWYIRYGLNVEHATDLIYSTPPKVQKLSNIKRPATRLFVADSMDTNPKYLKYDKATIAMRGPRGFDALNPLYPGHWIGPSEKQPVHYASAIGPISDRHKIGSNLVFFDGHVTWFKYQDAMFQKTDSTVKRADKVAMWNQNAPAIWNNVNLY